MYIQIFICQYGFDDLLNLSKLRHVYFISIYSIFYHLSNTSNRRNYNGKTS